MTLSYAAESTVTPDLWSTCVSGHAARTWGDEWDWFDLVRRIRNVTGIPTPAQAWDLTVIARALCVEEYAPQSWARLSGLRLHRIRASLRLLSARLCASVNDPVSREFLTRLLCRNLRRLGHTV